MSTAKSRRSDAAHVGDAGPRFAGALIEWHARGGRHELPWQRDRSPYRVWVSEIMLQQTQVGTVMSYYERFMQRFPDVVALADAPLDGVLHLWSGLGYYARARNLHRAAVCVRDEHGGRFPESFEAVARLPGVGRSTAGAILALSSGQRFPILDGNVRRVLTRQFGIASAASDRNATERLWRIAEDCTPTRHIDVYTQAIMDLGATICTRRNPACGQCPVAESCVARLTGRQHELPAARRRPERSLRQAFMVAARRHDGSVLLERRPERGIWGGLWCLPQFDTRAEAEDYLRHTLNSAAPRPLETLRHAFTHFDLVITPLLAHCSGINAPDPARHAWYRASVPDALGLPAPISKFLRRLASEAVQEQLLG
jgi:A/G-specific adenine glycosylase